MKRKDRWKRIQTKLGFEAKDIDGVPGPMTLGALERAMGIGAMGYTPPKKRPPAQAASLDKRTLGNINSLLPQVRPIFTDLAKAGKEIAARYGCDYRAISGTRTFAEQDKLYAQGRTKPGNIVTKVKGGYSRHNFGIALDFGVFDKKTGKYLDAADPSRAIQVHKAVGALAKQRYGGDIDWGGDWSRFRDYPHFQFDTGYTMAQMRDRLSKRKPIA